MKFLGLVLLLLSFFPILAEESFVDQLAAEIARWKEFIETNSSVEEDWNETRKMTIHGIAKAKRAHSLGHRLYALHLLATVRTRLAVHKYLAERPSEWRIQTAAVKTESKRIRNKLEPVLSGKEKLPVAGLSAAGRAVAEVSFSEIKRHYEKSLAQDSNTASKESLYSILSANAQYEFAQWCSSLNSETSAKKLRFNSLNREIDLFEKQILSGYKSPDSIQNPQINSMIKQARELILEGMEYGALYRLLGARILYSIDKPTNSSMTSEEAVERARELTQRFKADNADHSIGNLFLEMALYESTEMTHGSRGRRIAQIIFEEVIPHYLAALSPTDLPPTRK